MGQHRRKSKAGHIRLSRAERDHMDTCVHEATHAVVGIALGLKLGDEGVFVYDPRYPADRFRAKMIGAAGITSWDREVHVKFVEDGKTGQTISEIMAPEVLLQQLPWVDKQALSRATESDKKTVEHFRSTIGPDGLSEPGEGILTGDGRHIDDPIQLAYWRTVALLTIPSILKAIGEIANRLLEKTHLLDAEVRDVLARSCEQCREDDIKKLGFYLTFTEKGLGFYVPAEQRSKMDERLSKLKEQFSPNDGVQVQYEPNKGDE